MIIVRVLLTALVISSPFFAGQVFCSGKKEQPELWILEYYLTGSFIMLALFQLLAVPLIRLKASFSLLCILYICCSAALMAAGLVKLKKHKCRKPSISFPRAPVMWVVLILTAGLVIYQMIMYIFGMHIDADDARWVAEANDTLRHGTMLLHNPATGSYLGELMGDMRRDAFSPWPIYWAFLSRISGISAPVMVHTILPPLLLLFSYMVFYRMGSLIFYKINSRLIFLFSVAVINLFFYGDAYTESAFTLIRIWQGKAALIAIGTPGILSQVLMIQQEDTVRQWLMLAVIACACCLFSGMGMILAIITVGGYGLYLVICKRRRRIPLWLLALFLPILYEVLYQLNL